MQIITVIDFMGRAIKLFLVLSILCISTITCQNNSKVDKLDSSKILEVSLTYILNHQHLVKEYHNQPLQIVDYKKNALQDPIVVNGRKSLILPDTTNSYRLLRKMDVSKPLPLVEIIDITYKTVKVITVELILRATGHGFLITLEENKNGELSVTNISEFTV
jgi:hypothetical protein